jgi:predicted transcriptional regulator
MARPRSTGPTAAELQILHVLWTSGPSTVRQIHNALKQTRRSGYNSALKLIQIMHDKGLVRRDESVRPLIFKPAMTREKMQRWIVQDVAERAFQGSMDDVIATAKIAA